MNQQSPTGPRNRSNPFGARSGSAGRPRSRSRRPVWMRFLPIVVMLVGLVSRGQLGHSGNRSVSRSTNQSANQSQRSQTRTPITFGQSKQNVDADYSIGFASKQKFDDHFVKHGGEFPGVDQMQYLRMAQEMRDAPLSGTLIEARQARGNISRFDRSSGAFLAFGNNKTIFTFFRPNDGEAYFNRAAKRKV